MEQPLSIKPQDVAILAKLLVVKSSNWRQVDIAMDLGISQGEVAKALARLAKANLVFNKKVNRAATLEFLIHAVKYMFPVELGALAVGVPTGISAPIHEKMVVQNGDVYVWPSLSGDQRGQAVKPFYPKLAEAAKKDKDFYGLMAAIEILRLGRARERKMAEQYIEKQVKSA